MSEATPDIQKFFKFVDDNQELYIKRLSEVVAIPSVSSDAGKRDDVVRMGKWLESQIKNLGGTVELRDIGTQKIEGKEIPLPPILLGHFGTLDPKKITLCVYGHYDVQPASKSDGWNTEPFELVEKDGKLFGRGSTDDKGPVISWLWVVEAFKKTGKDLPVNLKFVFEGMEESGSEGLEDLIVQESKKFLADVDYFCISDNYWLGKEKPCITYGLRGICYFTLQVEGSSKDLHSGVYGGTVHEGMTDLIKLMSTLVDSQGNILVPGIMDQVASLTPEESKLYENIDFNIEEYKKDVGVTKLLHDSKESLLKARWRYPTLSLHGIEGAFYGPGAKTVIPAKVIGKFSLRIVPHMQPKKVEQLVKDHIQKEFSKLNSPNKLNVTMIHGAEAWLSDFNNPNYVAGRQATKLVYGVEPDLTREGGSIPITLTFEKATGKNVMLLPVGAGDDGAHSQNEKLDRRNYINGIKLLGVYLDALSKQKVTNIKQDPKRRKLQ